MQYLSQENFSERIVTVLRTLISDAACQTVDADPRYLANFVIQGIHYLELG